MEFRIKKCTTLIMIIKKIRNDKIERTNQESIRTLGIKVNYKYLGISEADNTKQKVIKAKLRKMYLGRTIKLLETKLQ